mmetsp:Transcript_82715/g.221810  ORF Transcript_82715/g.221810 Transcript_82715/m.221810 type:complete len:212 (+) Transcript_82715:896-1531(+)
MRPARDKAELTQHHIVHHDVVIPVINRHADALHLFPVILLLGKAGGRVELHLPLFFLMLAARLRSEGRVENEALLNLVRRGVLNHPLAHKWWQNLVGRGEVGEEEGNDRRSLTHHNLGVRLGQEETRLEHGDDPAHHDAHRRILNDRHNGHHNHEQELPLVLVPNMAELVELQHTVGHVDQDRSHAWQREELECWQQHDEDQGHDDARHDR